MTRRLRTAVGLTLLGLLIAGTTVGCVGRIGETSAELDESQTGPFPDDYQNIVTRWFERNLRNVSKVDNVTVERPVPGYFDTPRIPITGTTYGWSTEASCWPTTRAGLPMGSVYYSLLLRNGKVVHSRKLLR